MNFQDLNKPLGLPKPRRADPGSRPPTPWRGAIVAGALLVALGSVGYARLGPDGMAILISGRPPPPRETVREIIVQAPAPAPTPEAAPGVSMSDVTGSTGSASLPPRAQGHDVEEAAGVKVVRQGGGAAPPSMIISVPAPRSPSALAPAPDPRLVEATKGGPLPRIGPDGARPMTVYARPAPAGGGKPRLGLVIGAMGLNPQVTSEAIERLPEAVTLGFAPYGRNLAQQAASAREDGHEVLLQAPMDGFASEADDPGPNVLRTGGSALDTISRLQWHMTRFPGYVGVGGYMGAKFMADAGSMTTAMTEVAKRGLFFFDEGSVPRSQAAAIGEKRAFLSCGRM